MMDGWTLIRGWSQEIESKPTTEGRHARIVERHLKRSSAWFLKIRSPEEAYPARHRREGT